MKNRISVKPKKTFFLKRNGDKTSNTGWRLEGGAIYFQTKGNKKKRRNAKRTKKGPILQHTFFATIHS